MKPQDVLFFLVFAVILYSRNPKLSAAVGIACLLLSIPLFSFWIFFTAERLTWYAAALFLLSIFLSIKEDKKRT